MGFTQAARISNEREKVRMMGPSIAPKRFESFPLPILRPERIAARKGGGVLRIVLWQVSLVKTVAVFEG